ncbi:MAG: ATP-binding cassette domain-containing protein [Pseudohongiellaceae bacterium]
MISLSNAVLIRGPQTLLDHTNLVIQRGHKIGIIGRNGSGKSSLFACLRGELPLEEGELQLPEKLRIASMRQEILDTQRKALEFVIDGDNAYRELERQLSDAESNHDDAAIARIHSELDALDAYSVTTRARQLLSGLGFGVEQFELPVSAFSGGWRIRLNLAAALMCPSDLLMLDEPTNHLDLEATLWLEGWLARYQGTLLIISHDRDFLDRVIDGVVSFENHRLVYYRGNFSAYEVQRAERLALQQAMYEKQQRRRAEIEDFVRRFRYKATKARQAQSRLKVLKRMEEIAAAHVDSPFHFRFPQPLQQPEFLLTLDKLAIGFDRVLVSDINLSVRSTTRIGLLGVNGCGKSTLLKVLGGMLLPLGGEINRARGLRVGYFAQHQVDVLNLQTSPLAQLQLLRPQQREQDIRDYLGGFDFQGNRVLEPVINFSGGEKARLALAIVCWQQPNLLLMDEPTNHLDLEMRHALTVALQEFSGAVIIVSHDRHLLNNTVDEFYLIRDGKCKLFDGDLSDYEKMLLTAVNVAEMPRQADVADTRPEDKKQRRQQAAVKREQLAPQRRKLQQLEKMLTDLGREVAQINDLLADGDLYEAGRKIELNRLLQRQGEVIRQLAQTEESWLQASEELEQLLQDSR